MFFDDMIKLTLFLSVPIFPERNISRLKDVMVDRGYSNYILKRPDVKKIDLKEGDKDGGLNSNNTTYETLLQPALISYILRYIGTDLEIDKCKCLHPLIIEDWLAYDWEKRTKYDLTIASMYACFGSSKIQAKIDEKQKTDKELDVTKYFHSAI
jgi:hypothetical protein